MNTFLTAVAFLILIAVAAYVIHRLNLQHAERIAAYRYSAPRLGRCVPQPYHALPASRPTGGASEPSAQSRGDASRRTPGPRTGRGAAGTRGPRYLSNI
jgi:hypothetical protein